MCNHYLKNIEVLEWAVRMIGIGLPEPRPEVPEHTWPKKPAHVVIDREGSPSLELLRWGVWPFYEKKMRKPLTNARDDSLLVKPVWRESVVKRRCLIPAAGYFEPGEGPDGARGELRFSIKERPCFFFAGLWDTDPDGSGNRAFTMVTTRPNEYAARYHDRMPVVLADSDARSWLGSSRLPDARVLSLCQPLPSELMDHVAIPPQPRVKKITKHDVQAAGSGGVGELDLS